MSSINFYINKEIRDKVNRFKNKQSLTTGELSEIKLYLQQHKDILQNTTFFQGSVKDTKIVSCIADSFFEEIFNFIENTFSPDISIIASPKHKEVLFKQSKEVININFLNLIKLLCDENNHSVYNNIIIAPLTTKFINFTQKLTVCTPPLR